MLARAHAQRGAVLAVSLALLLILTLLALAASRATRSQTDFAASVRERDVAFQAAEAALRAGERLLASTTPAPCAAERCEIYGANQLERGPMLQSPEWRRRRAWAYTAADEWIPWSESLERDRPADETAAFVIEEYFHTPAWSAASPDEPAPGVTTYRITAAGYTRTGRPAVILQTTFAQAGAPAHAVVPDAATGPIADHGAGEGVPYGRQSWRQLR
jgi:type IV pilus assembly protein PilX